MRIGDTSGEIQEQTENLCFTFVNKIKLLGFSLNNYGNYVADNYDKIIRKVENLIRFWERFCLSLMGKIAIYKSLFMPQINYVATICTPSVDTISDLEKIMEKFVLKGFNIAVNRCYLPIVKGGIGMFKLKDFISRLPWS
jgi:hypothetical protein